jgi:hypothetical protein
VTCSRTALLLLAFGLATAALAGCGDAWPGLSSLPFDLDGQPFDPFAESDARASAFLFVHSACPVSNRLAPEVRRIQEAFATRRVAFWLVYPDPSDTPDLIRRHVAEYGYGAAGILRDPEHALVAATGVTRTPEVAVYDARGARVYRGRVNDRFVEFGKTRPAPTRHDLAGALDAALAGHAVDEPETEAIGCYIADLR